MDEQQQKKSSIEFRQEALESFTISDRTDQLIQVTTVKSWILLATLGTIVAAILIWGIWGKITIWVEGQGMLLPEKGSIHKAEAPIGPGQISEIKVQPQARIKKDDIVAVLDTANLTKQVETTRLYVAELKRNYNEQATIAKDEIAKRQKTLVEQNQIAQRVLTTLQENLHQTEKLLEERKELLEKKLTTNQLYHDSLNRHYDIKKQFESAQEQVVRNQLDVENFIDRWDERLNVLDRKIKDEQLNLNNLVEKFKLSKHVKSPVDGIVISVDKAIGEIVNTGDPIVTIATFGNGLQAVVFLPPKDGKKIQHGLKVLISPQNVKKEEYGSIQGKVTTVSSFPLSQQSILAVLQNENLVKEFTKDGSPISIWVELEKDLNTPSKLKWSSSQGPMQEITSGSLISARVMVREQNPFSLIFQNLKKVLEP